jgi:hypothetical protein
MQHVGRARTDARQRGSVVSGCAGRRCGFRRPARAGRHVSRRWCAQPERVGGVWHTPGRQAAPHVRQPRAGAPRRSRRFESPAAQAQRLRLRGSAPRRAARRAATRPPPRDRPNAAHAAAPVVRHLLLPGTAPIPCSPRVAGRLHRLACEDSLLQLPQQARLRLRATRTAGRQAVGPCLRASARSLRVDNAPPGSCTCAGRRARRTGRPARCPLTPASAPSLRLRRLRTAPRHAPRENSARRDDDTCCCADRLPASRWPGARRVAACSRTRVRGAAHSAYRLRCNRFQRVQRFCPQPPGAHPSMAGLLRSSAAASACYKQPACINC